jgi:hypothetical protein
MVASVAQDGSTAYSLPSRHEESAPSARAEHFARMLNAPWNWVAMSAQKLLRLRLISTAGLLVSRSLLAKAGTVDPPAQQLILGA